ncbi:hypothetical protein DD237_007504 [Peronospora effusa]|uniref:Uncharacterized protein n=1 Tax=Peronospora effusa TaxID=542832 RepID=A0A3R7XBF4_9STRA|nr:hypothetical protein DD237_007504 [Peronospora effusa]
MSSPAFFCVILTTHNTEECEALCTRVGILLNDDLKCLGSVEHLKQKFGQSYIVEVKMQGSSLSSVERLQIEVQRILRCNSLGVLQDHINILCRHLKFRTIVEGKRNGNVLQSHLETSGTIPINVFCAWWYTKDVGGALQLKLIVNFQAASSLDTKVPKQSLRPYAIFGFLDENKERLHIDVYGVSETLLEHIFNTMAVYKGDEQLQGSARYRSAS